MLLRSHALVQDNRDPPSSSLAPGSSSDGSSCLRTPGLEVYFKPTLFDEQRSVYSDCSTECIDCDIRSISSTATEIIEVDKHRKVTGNRFLSNNKRVPDCYSTEEEPCATPKALKPLTLPDVDCSPLMLTPSSSLQGEKVADPKDNSQKPMMVLQEINNGRMTRSRKRELEKKSMKISKPISRNILAATSTTSRSRRQTRRVRRRG